VSRGRFQDVDESAYYEYVLKRAGIGFATAQSSSRTMGVCPRKRVFFAFCVNDMLRNNPMDALKEPKTPDVFAKSKSFQADR